MVKIWTRDEYHKQLGWKRFWKEDCPFCNAEEQEWHTLWKGKHWYILHNLYPYSGNEQHLMAVPYAHREVSIDLTEDELKELKEVHQFMSQYFWGEHYFSCTRESFWNRSIEHYHVHFIPGKLQGKYLRKMLENQGFPIREDLES